MPEPGAKRIVDPPKILFVDNYEGLARLSCEILEMQGYRAVAAHTAEEALEKFNREQFDLVVTDFRMEGTDGLELARQVHTTNPDIPVIIVTGYDSIKPSRDANAVVQKGEMFPALLEHIRTLLQLGPEDLAEQSTRG